jgi:hypothetical protein
MDQYKLKYLSYKIKYLKLQSYNICGGKLECKCEIYDSDKKDDILGRKTNPEPKKPKKPKESKESKESKEPKEIQKEKLSLKIKKIEEQLQKAILEKEKL